MQHVLVADADLKRHNVAGELGGKGNLAGRSVSPVLGHEQRPSAGHALDGAEEPATSGKLRVGRELD